MGHFDPEVFQAIVEQVAQTIQRAQSHLRPIRIAYRQGLTNGLVVNRVDPHGVVDPELIVCAFYGLTEDDPFAILVNFAAHPTTLGAWNMALSADYPGALVRALEKRWPSATGVFFSGSVGDQAPIKHGEDDAPAHYLGQQLAAHAMALLEGVQPVVPAGVHALHEKLPLPPARLRLGRFRLPRWVSQRFVDDDATLSLAVIGEVAFQGVPCDVTAGLGQQLKEAARASALKPIVVGFVNDYIGYCIPEALYGTDAYEARLAFHGPQAGTLVVEGLIELLGRLMPAASTSGP
jgi:hypothetical protein